jgi:hypothetical protein
MTTPPDVLCKWLPAMDRWETMEELAVALQWEARNKTKGRRGPSMGRKRNQEKWEEVARLRVKGLTVETIARLVGMQVGGVRYVIATLGIPYVAPPPRCRRSKVEIPDDHGWDMRRGDRSKVQANILARRVEWKRLYEKEMYSTLQISQMYGRHHSVVMRELKLAGVTPRPVGSNRMRPLPPGMVKHALPVDISTRRALAPYAPANPKFVERMMAISLKIERRGRGMLA